MILVIDATATDSDGNVLSGSVAVEVNIPAAAAAPSAQPAAQPAAQPQQQLAGFQQRSLMLARGWTSR